MKHKISTLLIALCSFMMMNAFAQEAPLDTLTRSVANMRSELDVLKRIKVSGYIQTQFQVADSTGISTFAGSDFKAAVDKRFTLRRGRVKVQYDGAVNEKGWSTSQYVFQFDVSEKGLTIKDVYAKFTDPCIGWLSVTAGMQNRPFGYEIGYSSSLRESPERGRLSQTIFPGERDLGMMLTIQGPKASKWNALKIDAGLFNGTGGPSAGADATDFDKFKDMFARISLNKTSKSEKVKWGIGASMCNGGYRVDTFDVYKASNDSTPGFMIDVKKSTVNPDMSGRAEAKRNCMGFDAQVSMDWSLGITTLRAEYISGTQPGTSSSTKSAAAAVTSDSYLRNFSGAYFYFLQNIGKTPLQAIVKYDWYDPNTDVEGDGIGKGVKSGYKKTGSADIKYTTLGVGLAYRWDANTKITLYDDMVTNETSANLSGFGKDLKDNVLTLRVQVKF